MECGNSAARAQLSPHRPRGVPDWLLMAPPAGYFLLLFAAPLLGLAREAVAHAVSGQAGGVGWSLGNFAAIAQDPLYLHAAWTTLRIGGACAGLALLLGYPLAVFLARSTSRFRGMLLFLVLMPSLVSVVVRAYGWIVLLSNRGLVNGALLAAGLIHRPLHMIFNETGIVIGTTHVLLAFMVLSILGSLATIDTRLEDAAASLGAVPWRVFRDVTLPLSLPGAAAGTALVFVLAVSSFVTPVLLGGQLVLTLPILALQQFGTVFDWPLGSALVMVLLALMLGATLLAGAVTRRAMR